MKIFITGDCGYKGYIFFRKLLIRGHEAVAFDLQWFGNYLASHQNLKVENSAIRDIDKIPMDGSIP